MSETSQPHDQGSPVEITRLLQLASMAPNDPDLRIELAEMLLRRGLRDEAVSQIRAAIALSPNHLEGRKLLERVLAS